MRFFSLKIFLTGIVLGSHFYGTPSASNSAHQSAQVSPLAAATANRNSASSEIQKLILESAQVR